jgi:hypothetical protein
MIIIGLSVFSLQVLSMLILSTIFQPSPYGEGVNLPLNFYRTHMSSQINGGFIRFKKKKKKKKDGCKNDVYHISALLPCFIVTK